MGITEISKCELFNSSSGEDPCFTLLGKLDPAHHTHTEQVQWGGGQRKERSSHGDGLGDLDLTCWRSTVELQSAGGLGRREGCIATGCCISLTP